MRKKERLAFGRRHHNLLVWLVCLLLAVIVWLYVMRVDAPQYEEVYRDITVSVVESDSLDFTGSVDEYLNIRVLGTKEALATYGKDDIVAYVRIADLADREGPVEAGTVYEMTVQLELPEGLSTPDTYRVRMLLQGKS